jgi:hypothetical protein
MNTKQTQDTIGLIRAETARMDRLAQVGELTTYHLASLLAQVAQLAQYLSEEQKGA